MKNKLKEWITIREDDEKQVMNLLQEYGVVSDNCVTASEVGNDIQAMKWMACNYHLLSKNNSV